MTLKRIPVIAAGACRSAGAIGCNYAVEGFQDSVEDFVAESVRKKLEMIFPPNEEMMIQM